MQMKTDRFPDSHIATCSPYTHQIQKDSIFHTHYQLIAHYKFKKISQAHLGLVFANEEKSGDTRAGIIICWTTCVYVHQKGERRRLENGKQLHT